MVRLSCCRGCVSFLLCVAIASVSSAVADNPSDVQAALPPDELFVKLEPHSVELKDDVSTFVVDAGNVPCSGYFEIPVFVKNSTLTALGPLKGKTSCSCLLGVMKDQIIAAGQKSEIRIRFATPAEPRRIEQRLQVYSEKEVGRGFAVELSGRAKRLVEIQDPRVAFPTGQVDVDFELTIVPQFPNAQLNRLVLKSLDEHLRVKEFRVSDDGTRISASCHASAYRESIDGRTDARIAVVSGNEDYRFAPVELHVVMQSPAKWRVKPALNHFDVGPKDYEASFFLFPPGTAKENELQNVRCELTATDGGKIPARLKDVIIKPRMVAVTVAVDKSQIQSVKGKEIALVFSLGSVELGRASALVPTRDVSPKGDE